MPELTSIRALERAVIRTVVYFDFFDYPLTSLELLNYLSASKELPRKITLGELVRILESSDFLQKKLEHSQGLIFLLGQSAHLRARRERYVLADTKFKIALRGARAIRYVPFLSFVAVCNTLASNNAKADSDIDLLIGVQHGRLFLTRILVTLILSVLGLRRHGKKITDRLCLSFYLTDQSYNLDSLRIHEDDVHFAWWASQIIPILGHDEFEKFFNANGWLDSFLHSRQKKIACRRRRVTAASNFMLEQVLKGSIGNLLEQWASRLQQFKFARNEHSLASEPDTRVVISDSILKFHENDRRLDYRAKYYEQLLQLDPAYATND